MQKQKYLNLIREFTFCWFKLRDQGKILGFLWSFLSPLLMSVILYFLFKSRVGASADKNYFIYILIGTVVWNFFTISIQTNIGVLIRRAPMVRNVVFPKEILVFSQTGVFVLQYFYELSVIFLFIIIAQVGFSIHLILLPLIVTIEVLLIVSLSLFFSCICVYAKDLEHIWTVISRMGFFMVPIFYKTEYLSEKFQPFILSNPMTQIMIFYRDILLYHRWPDFASISLVTLFSVMLFLSGYKFFLSTIKKIAEDV